MPADHLEVSVRRMKTFNVACVRSTVRVSLFSGGSGVADHRDLNVYSFCAVVSNCCACSTFSVLLMRLSMPPPISYSYAVVISHVTFHTVLLVPPDYVDQRHHQKCVVFPIPCLAVWPTLNADQPTNES